MVGKKEQADAIPSKFLGGVYAEFKQPGVLVREELDPGSPVQFKEFNFAPRFGPHGWWYERFVVSLQRFSPQGSTPAFATFYAEWTVGSYGRHSDNQVWPYDLILIAGSTPLRRIHMGSAGIPCFKASGRFQGSIPPPVHNQDFPLPYFGLITNVRLDSQGLQESC